MSVLLRRITSRYVGDFYCLSCFHLYSTEKKLKKHEKVRNGHDYCHIEMPNENNKILKYNHGEKPMKSLFIIYADWECLPEDLSPYHDNPDLKRLLEKICPEKSYTEKNMCIYFLVIHCLHNFHLFQQKISLIVIEVKTVWKSFVRIWKSMQKNNQPWKKEMMRLTDEENKSYEKQKICYICKKEFSTDDDDNEIAFNKNYQKVRDDCLYTGNAQELLMMFLI